MSLREINKSVFMKVSVFLGALNDSRYNYRYVGSIEGYCYKNFREKHQSRWVPDGLSENWRKKIKINKLNIGASRSMWRDLIS